MSAFTVFFQPRSEEPGGLPPLLWIRNGAGCTWTGCSTSGVRLHRPELGAGVYPPGVRGLPVAVPEGHAAVLRPATGEDGLLLDGCIGGESGRESAGFGITRLSSRPRRGTTSRIISPVPPPPDRVTVHVEVKGLRSCARLRTL